MCVYDLSEAKTSRGQTVECHKGQHESAGRLLKILRKEEHNQSVFFFLFFFCISFIIWKLIALK